jgi:predicted alpha/beta hydrolase
LRAHDGYELVHPGAGIAARRYQRFAAFLANAGMPTRRLMA